MTRLRVSHVPFPFFTFRTDVTSTLVLANTEGANIVLGVLLCVAGSTLTVLGMVLQKLSHRRQQERARLNSEAQSNCLSNPDWWLGL